MASNPAYTKYHPKWYRRRIPIFWWVHRRAHTRFILRELTCIAVAFYALVLLFFVRAVAQGPDAYASFMSWFETPLAIILHAIVFAFVLFHSITWFNLAPKALVFRVGKNRIPDAMIAASNYVAWIVISTTLAWIILTR